MNVTFDEYVAKPMTAAQIAKMRKWVRFHKNSFLLSSLLASAVGFIVWPSSLGLVMLLVCSTPFGAAFYWVSTIYIKNRGGDAVFIVDGRILFAGDGNAAMSDIPEEPDAILSRFKSDDAQRLITAIAVQGRPLVRAELYLAEIMEERFKEALHNGETPAGLEG
jgi:hypothetical protein